MTSEGWGEENYGIWYYTCIGAQINIYGYAIMMLAVVLFLPLLSYYGYRIKREMVLIHSIILHDRQYMVMICLDPDIPWGFHIVENNVEDDGPNIGGVDLCIGGYSHRRTRIFIELPHMTVMEVNKSEYFRVSIRIMKKDPPSPQIAENGVDDEGALIIR